MRVLRLQADNILRLVAVDITPQGNLVIVGGKNSAGKSSVLNAIAMALGGKDMCPSEPIRAGETEGKIVVTLDDLVVTRRFSRNRPPCDCGVTNPGDVPIIGDDEMHTASCASLTKWSETHSTLVVKNKEGAHYPTPQGMLDKLLGRLTFDPLAFARMGETTDGAKRQADVLRKLVGLETGPLDARRRALAEERATIKKLFAIKDAQLDALPEHKDAPDAEVPMEEISREMLHAEELRRSAEEAERTESKAQETVLTLERGIQAHNDKIAALQKQIEDMQRDQVRLGQEQDNASHVAKAASAFTISARAAVPDPTTLRQRLTEVEAANAKVRANRKRTDFVLEVGALASDIESKDAEVKAADEAKSRLLDAAIFPVEGLAVSDDGVTFGGLPFSQVSTSEQLRVSVAVGIALNPNLKVLLVRNGNALDDDAMQALAAQADEAACQVWCEYVTSNDEGVQVMIEEGRVAAREETVDATT